MAILKKAHAGFLYFSLVIWSCRLLLAGIVTRLLIYFPDKSVALYFSLLYFSVHASFMGHSYTVVSSSATGIFGHASSSLSLPLPRPRNYSSLDGYSITGGCCVDAWFLSWAKIYLLTSTLKSVHYHFPLDRILVTFPLKYPAPPNLQINLNPTLPIEIMYYSFLQSIFSSDHYSYSLY